MIDTMKVMLDPGAFMPERAHKTDAGLDMKAPQETVIPAHGSAKFDTGVHIELPHGYYARVSPRSGLNAKHSVTTFGCVIDEGYTGSIILKLYNFSDTDYTVKQGDRIAQLVIMPYLAPELEVVSELEDTDRGADGFGSTGR